MKDYTQLRTLLAAQETFPCPFTYKFIGLNSPGFAAAVVLFEKSFPSITHQSTRESAGGKHLSKTYVFEAADVDAIIEVYRAIEKLEDLVIVL
ncbi:DUF493 domain-containing protein [Bdellovibrionota bacterium FG-1]